MINLPENKSGEGAVGGGGRRLKWNSGEMVEQGVGVWESLVILMDGTASTFLPFNPEMH